MTVLIVRFVKHCNTPCNLHCGLTAPDDPQRHQTHKVGTNIPENIKVIILALNGLIEDAIQNRMIHHRTEML